MHHTDHVHHYSVVVAWFLKKNSTEMEKERKLGQKKKNGQNQSIGINMLHPLFCVIFMNDYSV